MARVTNEQLEALLLDLNKRLQLNGHADAIKRLALAAPKLEELANISDKLIELSNHSPQIISVAAAAGDLLAVVQERQDRRGFSRTLKRIFGWDHGTKALVVTIISGIVGSTAYVLWMILLHH